jgi:hypothetical protein
MLTWIFQGNPDDFDLDAYLATAPIQFAMRARAMTRFGSSLQLLVAGSDPNALWRILTRRGEVVVSEQLPNRPPQAEIDV